MNINNYYLLAKNDYLFLQLAKDSGLYNNIAVQSQQVVEKYLKHLVYTFCIDNKEALRALRSHSLVKLNSILLESGIDLGLSKGDLAILKDYYYDAKYPGDNFIRVSEEDAKHSLEVVEEVKKKVENYLKSIGYCHECGSIYKNERCTNPECVNFKS
ncbi:MAG: HEPN domain-containing protein [Clostridiales bacterium]|nr:HEPN domain-containing protein [Clostridiales bacterium]